MPARHACPGYRYAQVPTVLQVLEPLKVRNGDTTRVHQHIRQDYRSLSLKDLLRGDKGSRRELTKRTAECLHLCERRHGAIRPFRNDLCPYLSRVVLVDLSSVRSAVARLRARGYARDATATHLLFECCWNKDVAGRLKQLGGARRVELALGACEARQRARLFLVALEGLDVEALRAEHSACSPGGENKTRSIVELLPSARSRWPGCPSHRCTR